MSLCNLAQDRFYYCDEIVNVFIEKMERTIGDKVRRGGDDEGALPFSHAFPPRLLSRLSRRL